MNIKNILLIGRTGSGKSTLANVLINKNGNFTEVFKESAGSISQTKNIQVQEFMLDLGENEKIRYLVIDTAGFGDTQLSNKEVLQLLQELVKIIGNDGINRIFLVNGGRFAKEEIDLYQILESVLFDENVVKYTTIVRTRFPEFTEEEKCEADRQKLQTENQELLGILKNSKIIYVDNPPLVGLPSLVETGKESRKLSHERLILHLGTCQSIYKPANLVTLQQRINDYQTKTEQLEKELKEKEQFKQKREVELQQQISSLQTQQQSELNSTRQYFNSQLNEVRADQQKQIKEIDEKHQRELNWLRRGSVSVAENYCAKGHSGVNIDDMDFCEPFSDQLFYCSTCGHYGSGVRQNITYYTFEEYARMQRNDYEEKVRQVQQQIQDQERRNREEISSINQQINQRQSSINNQRSSEENSISQRYQQTENNLRNELQQRVNEVQNARQELNRLQNEFNNHIEQKMPPHR